MIATHGTHERIFDKLYVGGRWIEPSSDAFIQVICPMIEEVIATVPKGRNAATDAAVTLVASVQPLARGRD
jgi:aldehyde dehydrogenase (NAD+)